MSTVPGFPDATSPTPETGLLWLTEGSGTTRDKKVQAGTLVTDLLGRAVNSQATAATPIAGATDLIPVSRGDTGGKASVDAVVGAGLPGAIAGFAAPYALADTDTLPLLQSATMTELPLSTLREYALIPGAVLSLADVSARNAIYAGLAQDTLAVAAPESRIALSSRAGYYALLDFLIAFQGYSANPFNATQAGIEFNLGFELTARNFPTLVPCALHKYDSGKALLSVTTCYAHVERNAGSNIADVKLVKSDGAIMIWDDVLGGASVEYGVIHLSTVLVAP